MSRTPTLSDVLSASGAISAFPVEAACHALREARGEAEESWATLESFAPSVNRRFVWYDHAKILGSVLESVVSGELSRVMIFMPPRHGKSELASRILPAYYLRHHPDRWVGINSYSADLARTFSRSARDHYRESGGVLRDDAGAVTHWETLDGGGTWAAGVGGPITGKGFHLGIIDDPIKNAEEASSETIRHKQRDWYQSTFATREEPGGAIVLIMTRWDEEDLAGWQLEEEEEKGEEHWHIVDLPAIEDPSLVTNWPETCTIERGNRKEGEPLCPERYDIQKLGRIRRRVGEYYWFGLYQQRPRTTIGKGRVYRNFSGHNLADVEDAGGDLYVGMDFNVDPMTAVIGCKAGDQLHIFDEVELFNSGTGEICQEIQHRYPDRSIVVCPDPSGKQRRTSAPVGETDFAILERHGFRIRAPSAAPPVVDRINEVNHLLENAGERRLYIHPRCRTLIKALEKLTYKPGTSLVAKGKWDHATDALGYLVHQEFPMVPKRGYAIHLR